MKGDVRGFLPVHWGGLPDQMIKVVNISREGGGCFRGELLTCNYGISGVEQGFLSCG